MRRGLVKKQITDKTGKRTSVWVKPNQNKAASDKSGKMNEADQYDKDWMAARDGDDEAMSRVEDANNKNMSDKVKEAHKESPEDDAYGKGGNQLKGLKQFVHVYDNGGSTFDRYTIIIDGEMHGASENPFHPQGFGQYAGEVPSGWTKNKHFAHLGKRITDLKTLPEPVQKFIVERASED